LYVKNEDRLLFPTDGSTNCTWSEGDCRC